MSTLVLTQSYNPQSITWAGAGALWGLVQAFCVALVAVAVGAVLLGILAAVAMVPPTFWLGLGIVGVFALVTCPKAVRK